MANHAVSALIAAEPGMMVGVLMFGRCCLLIAQVAMLVFMIIVMNHASHLMSDYNGFLLRALHRNACPAG
jgi:hypothetical protein